MVEINAQSVRDMYRQYDVNNNGTIDRADTELDQDTKGIFDLLNRNAISLEQITDENANEYFQLLENAKRNAANLPKTERPGLGALENTRTNEPQVLNKDGNPVNLSEIISCVNNLLKDFNPFDNNNSNKKITEFFNAMKNLKIDTELKSSKNVPNALIIYNDSTHSSYTTLNFKNYFEDDNAGFTVEKQDGKGQTAERAEYNRDGKLTRYKK